MNRRMILTLGALFGMAAGATSMTASRATAGSPVERDNRKVFQRIVNDALNKHDLAALEAELSASMVDHDLPPGTVGPAGTRGKVAAFLAAFPDIRFTFESDVAEGDYIAGRGYFVGTHKGAFAGMPPTGKQVKVSFMDVWRFEKGKVVEYWGAPDRLSLMMQLGAIPTPNQ